MNSGGLEIHGSRYVSLAEIEQTLQLLQQRKISAVVSRTFRLEEAQQAHDLLKANGALGRVAIVMDQV
jgi:D-arabinose 1-dehydrogenase-like Zn-dependent alcohol dehydrogenase